MSLALSLAACGGGQKTLRVDDSRLVRLSADARQSILDVERPVRVAEVNLEGATAAEKDARSFLSIVESERSAAKQQLEAAEKTTKLAQSASDTNMAENARKDEDAARARSKGADAKLDYAKQLLEYRGDILKQRKAELDAARAELEVQKVQQLVAAGQAEGLDQRAFDKAAIDARRRAKESGERVDSRRGKVESRRDAWMKVRVSGPGVADAPPPPSALVDARE